MKALLLATLLLGQTYPGTYDPVVRDPALPDVLLIGDSISIAYTDEVRTLLDGIANVHRIPENGQRTIEGISRLQEAWICSCINYELVLFNFGLHDSRLIASGQPYTPILDYGPNLQIIIDMLQERIPKVSWVTTTFVPEPNDTSRTEANTELYTDEAETVLTANPTVDVLDLHTPSETNKVSWYNDYPNDVHFNSTGQQELAELVAAHIIARLAE